MRNLIITGAILLFTACAEQQKPDTKADSVVQSNKKIDSSTAKIVYQLSTFDDARVEDKIALEKQALKELSDKHVFANLSNQLKATVPTHVLEYFNTKPTYEILGVAQGELFQEGKTDMAFVVYDKPHQRVTILTYNANTNQYQELYRDIPVENGLEKANCNYGAFGTLDYQVAFEFFYMKDELLKTMGQDLDYKPCRIADISKDEDFLLKSGCFSNKVSRKETSDALCISTSNTYNSWECLRYNKKTKSFLVFYGQAFAD